MTKRKSKTGLFACLALAALLLTACGGDPVVVPDDALLTGTPQLVGLRGYVSVNETQLTMTMTDTYREDAEADAAILDAASFPEAEEDGVIAAGYVTRAQLAKIIPEDREIVVVTMKGVKLRELAEDNVQYLLDAKAGEPNAKYVHFSGVAFVYNKKAGAGSRIVRTAMLNPEEPTKTQELSNDKDYRVAMNSATAERLGLTPESTLESKEIERVIARMQDPDRGISPLDSRFVDKAELDAPKTVVTVLIVVGVAALAAIVIVYFVMKRKQKQARKKRGGEPRIDV